MLEEELKQGISEMHDNYGVVVLDANAGQDRPCPLDPWLCIPSKKVKIASGLDLAEKPRRTDLDDPTLTFVSDRPLNMEIIRVATSRSPATRL